jgi:GH35 family endo-1,4-beta-xylanase
LARLYYLSIGGAQVQVHGEVIPDRPVMKFVGDPLMSVCNNNTFIGGIMSILKMRSFGAVLIAAGGLCSVLHAELPLEFINATKASIDTLRKRECTLSLKINNLPSAGKTVTVKQIRNSFGFGAAAPKTVFSKVGIDTVKAQQAFRTYFEWLTPENEMKWSWTDGADDYSNFDDADWLIKWCAANDIKVRGHSLFWNEDEQWLPGWALELDTAQFKAAMGRRIRGAMEHFKGKVVHWDIINEIVHNIQHGIAVPGMLAQRSGDPDIFSWIFKQARAIDSTAKFGVNEYNIIEASSQAKEYITEIKSIESKGGRIDIVGLEGHFGGSMERSHYLERIDTIASALPGKELWLTEVDFELDTLSRADKLEELMRTAFAHPNIGGIMLWMWWEGNRWRSTYTSFLVDSNFTENELGARWRTVRDEWKTNLSGTTDAAGKYTFKGFHGKYVVSVNQADSEYTDTVYLEPGSGTKVVELNLSSATSVDERKHGIIAAAIPFKLNGRTLMLIGSAEPGQLNVSMYDLSGKLLSRKSVEIGQGEYSLQADMPAGCHIFRIGTAAGQVLYTGKMAGLR